MNETKEIVMYCDGGCRGNPGPGGWGVVLQYGGHEKTLAGHQADTTNNRMELTAACEGLEALKRACEITIYTDSTYVRDGITKWLPNWKARGWKTAAKTPVKNAELWQRLEAACTPHTIQWRWVKGHSGNPGNDLADQLANQAMDELGA